MNTNIHTGSYIINKLVDNELSLASLDRIIQLTGKTYPELKNSLRILVRDGQLSMIEKGLYVVRNFRDPYVIGTAMFKESAVAYWSALNLHGLTEQIPNIVYLQSIHSKRDKEVFGVRYKFVKIKPEKICGITTLGYGNEEFRITDTEKTLLDCFDLPQYSGGYEELIRAFYHAKISSTRLFEYGMQIGNLSVLKRLAFLSELFEMKGFSRFREQVLKILNQKYTLIDPMGLDRGEFVSKWRIRLNISRDDLLGMIKNVY